MEHSYYFSKDKEIKDLVCCPVCRRLCSKQRIQLHINNQHKQEKEFKCSHCDFQAVSSLYILNHIRSYHPGKPEKVYKIISHGGEKTSISTNHVSNETFKEKSCIRNTNKTSENHGKVCLKHSTETEAEIHHETQTNETSSNTLISRNKHQIEEQAEMTDNHSAYENALVVDNDMLQVTDADTMIETTQNVTETVLIIDESQNNQETVNITSDSVIIVDNIKNQEITEEVTITEVYTSDYQEFENCDSLPRNISNISNYTKEDREKIIIPSSGHNEQPTPANNEISVPGRKARNAKFTQKLSGKELEAVLKIKSQCGLCGVLISDKFVERHLWNKHNITILSSATESDTTLAEQNSDSSIQEKSSNSSSQNQSQSRPNPETQQENHLSNKQEQQYSTSNYLQPNDMKRKLCFLKVSKGHKMCGKCGQIYLKLKLHRKNCTG